MLSPWGLATGLLAVHALVRFGGLWKPWYVPLSMALVWPLPWVLSPRSGRRAMGFTAPSSWTWFVTGPLAAGAALAACAAVAWGLFGATRANWFTQHALALHESLPPAADGTSTMTAFWMVTGPAMLFSPIGEEFLFRGFFQTSVSMRWGSRVARILQAVAFGLIHLAHYGLVPLQPSLIAVWVPSMFGVALVLGWIVQRSGSVWPAVVAHSVFNLGLNGLAFVLLPDLVGV